MLTFSMTVTSGKGNDHKESQPGLSRVLVVLCFSTSCLFHGCFYFLKIHKHETYDFSEYKLSFNKNFKNKI